MTDLTDLIARVEAGEGADRGLDADIELALGNWTPEHHEAWCRYQECDEAINPPMMCVPVDPQWLTTSLDALMPLIGDQSWRVEDHPLAGPCAIVGDIDAYASTPARALLAAILRAKEAGQ